MEKDKERRKEKKKEGPIPSYCNHGRTKVCAQCAHPVLTTEETCLLSKGLNFCPTQQFVLFNTLLDVNRFICNVTIKKHYFASEVDRGDAPDVSFSPVSSNTFSFQEHCISKDLRDLTEEGTHISLLGFTINMGLQKI